MSHIVPFFTTHSLFKTLKTAKIQKKQKLSAGVFLRLKKESVLKINIKLDICIFKNVLQIKTLSLMKDLYDTSLFVIILNKKKVRTLFKYKKQYFYILLQMFFVLFQTQKDLFSQEIFSILETNVLTFKSYSKYNKFCTLRPFGGYTLQNKKKEISSELV